MEQKKLNILIVEDIPDDAELVIRQIRRSGFEPTVKRVDTGPGMEAALKERPWDIVIADHNLPTFSAMEALKILREQGLDIPFIIVSGSIGEEEAVATMKEGAHDFVLKDNLTRLVPAIEREIREAQSRRERRQADENLVQSERRLAEAQRIAQIGSWEADLRSGRAIWSPEMYRIFGVDPNSFVPTLDSIDERILPEDREKVVRARERAINRHEDYESLVHVVLNDGTHRVLHSMGKVIYDAEGQAIAMRGTAQDITDRERISGEKKRLEEQLSQAQKMEAIGRLAGGVAHDFNNLLSVIIGYCEIVTGALGKEPSLQQTVADIAEIRGAADRAATLTRQLLAFSRRQVLEPAVMIINESVESMEGMVRRLIGENINLQFILQKDLAPIKADPAQIEQVLMNLIVNARDAMPKGGHLRIETKNVKVSPGSSPIVPAGTYVLLSAADTGQGMDAETKSRVFEPFFTTKDKSKGTGLGLAMVYGVVKQTGGYIVVESEPGLGAKFLLYFPIVEDAKPTKSEAKTAGSVVHGSETVLFVEDDNAIRTMVTRFLRKNGYQVLDAPNAAEALKIAAEHGSAIDLMVTDIVMPGISGIDLARELKKYRGDIKVLFVSGYSDQAIFQNEVPELSTKYLSKPFTPQGLCSKIREILDR